MKITMLGFSGSGKTTLMYGMASALAAGNAEHDYAMIPRKSKDEELSSFGDEVDVLTDFLENAIENAGEWPAGTTKTTVYPFAIEYQSNNVITNIEMVDFRGGILTHLFNQNYKKDDDLKALFFHMIESNAVILVVDSYNLYYFKRMDEIRYFSGAKSLNMIMNRFNRMYPNRELNVLIVLTKADAIDPDWKEDDFKLLLDRGMEVFDPIVKLCKENSNWNGGIVPVSIIGEKNVERTVTPKDDVNHPFEIPFHVKDKITGLPQPFNTESVLYFCLGFTLSHMKNVAKETITEYQATIERALIDVGTLNRLWSFMRGKPSAEEIVKQSMKKKKEDEDSLQQFENHIEPLLEHTKKQVRLFV